jgi:hypothetical protein
MAGVELWCRVAVVDAHGTVLVGCAYEGVGTPSLQAVDGVARLALLAKRLGGGLVVSEASPAMCELLDLAGLPVEVGGQPELRKDRFGVQEEGHPSDEAP